MLLCRFSVTRFEISDINLKIKKKKKNGFLDEDHFYLDNCVKNNLAKKLITCILNV